MTSSIMEVNKILPLHVRRIDLTTGGDHSKGALQLGTRLTMVVRNECELLNHDHDNEKAITVDSIISRSHMQERQC